MEEIIKALELKKELDGLRPIDKEQEAIIMQKFRLDWNYHSNHLEGNTLTYGETKALILFGITAQGKTLKDTLEITGHNEAIDWVIDMVKGERPLTENFIRELHTLLLKEPYEKDAITADGKPTKKKIAVGQYKTTPNHVQTVTGEIFYFASPEETPAKMTDLLDWYKNKVAEADTNPLILAADFHYKFIRIHPFDDGNGRTARILMNFILMQFGFPPVIIKTEDKVNYFAALQLADAGNLEAFITYIAENLVRSLQIMIAGAKGESIEEPDDLDKEIALLEQRLSGYGNEIERGKSIDSLNDIYKNTIRKLAFMILEKLQKFEKYYLNHAIILHVQNMAVQFPNADTIIKDPQLGIIRLFVNYNTLKKTGLEDFHFTYDLTFEFNALTYSVFETNSEKVIFKKNYENLSDNELKKVLDTILKQHNKLMDDAINK